jgi:hypothetical protein
VFLRHQGCEFFFLSCRSLLSHRFPATALATPPAPAAPRSRSIWSSSSSQQPLLQSRSTLAAGPIGRSTHAKRCDLARETQNQL